MTDIDASDHGTSEFKLGDTVFVFAPPPCAAQPRRGVLVHLGRKWASVYLGDGTVQREIESLR